jgi:hypothetical protein
VSFDTLSLHRQALELVEHDDSSLLEYQDEGSFLNWSPDPKTKATALK